MMRERPGIPEPGVCNQSFLKMFAENISGETGFQMLSWVFRWTRDDTNKSFHIYNKTESRSDIDRKSVNLQLPTSTKELM